MRIYAFIAMIMSALLWCAPFTLAESTKAPDAVPSTWNTIDRPELGFSVKLPVAAQRKDGWDLVGSTHLWAVATNGTFYQIGVNEYNDVARFLTNSDGARKGMLHGIPTGFFKGIETTSHGTIQAQKMVREFEMNGFPATEYTYTFLSNDGHSKYSGRSIFCVNAKAAYTFTALTAAKPDLTAPFFASIKLK
jgi:hypothetical protein